MTAAFETLFPGNGRTAATKLRETVLIKTQRTTHQIDEKDKTMKIFDTLRQHMNEAESRRAMGKLDNHLRRDIGLPEVHDFPALPVFRV